MVDIKSIKSQLNKYSAQVEQGLDKVSEVAKKRFAGHEDKIDRAVDKVKQAIIDQDDKTDGEATTSEAETKPETDANPVPDAKPETDEAAAPAEGDTPEKPETSES